MAQGHDRKGVRGIRTMGRLVDGRRARTPAGALLELSAMANEKQLLTRELERWKHRHVEIESRLGEIAAKEARLLAMAAGSLPAGSEAAGGGLGAYAAAAARAEQQAQGQGPQQQGGPRMRVQEFSY